LTLYVQRNRFGFGFAHRLNWSTPLVIHGSYSNGGGTEHVGRGGTAAEFRAISYPTCVELRGYRARRITRGNGGSN
jgi:hypothetical protein